MSQSTHTNKTQQHTNIEPLLRPLRSIAKFKVRSHDTSKNDHIPLLRQALDNFQKGAGPAPVVCLVGDSMFERIITTGKTPNFGELWPSPTILDPSIASHAAALNQRGRVFNAGVGGDRIQNIAYRLAGTKYTAERGLSSQDDAHQKAEKEEEEEGEGKGKDYDGRLPALLPLLMSFGSIKLWVVHAGTNNLVPKKGLRDSDRDALRVLVRALLNLNPKGEGSRVLVTGLFYRRDEITKELVDRANDKIRDVVRELGEEFGRDRVRILAAPQSFDPGKHLEDHVHLTPEGYKLWMTQLVPAVVASLV